MSMMIPAWVDGKLTPIDKMQVHVEGLRHKAVSVFVLDGSRVLIQQRAMGKYHTPGLWANTCCTHPGWDESARDCAVRRLREELGIEGLNPVLRRHLEYRADVGGGLTEHEVVDLFCAEAPADLKIVPNPDEVMAFRWIDFYDLKAHAARYPALYTPWMRIYLEQYSDGLIDPARVRATA